MSHDIEDIITVIDGRPELVEEIQSSNEEVRTFIQERLKSFLTEGDFRNAVFGYLSTDTIGQARYQTLVDRVTRIGSQER